ncbi:MAG: hypothetical protein ACP5LX_03600 [Nitrososphaeria archaeon]
MNDLQADLRNKSRALARALYVRLNIPSHIIAEAFRENGIAISTKTVIKVAGRERVRGYDNFHNRQTYSWKKYFGKLYRRWRLIGKITAPLNRIMQAFWAWFAYSRMYGSFDLDAVLRGEKPP